MARLNILSTRSGQSMQVEYYGEAGDQVSIDAFAVPPVPVYFADYILSVIQNTPLSQIQNQALSGKVESLITVYNVVRIADLNGYFRVTLPTKDLDAGTAVTVNARVN